MVSSQTARGRGRPPQVPSQQTISPQAVSSGVATLRRINEDRQDQRARIRLVPRDDAEDEVDSPAPVYHSFLNTDPSSVLTLTNFSPREFERLWELVREHIAENWNTGRGKKCAYQAKDVLFMFLGVLKNCGKWDVVAAVYRIKAPSFQKMILEFAVVVSPFLYELMVAGNAEKYTMKKLALSGQTFAHHPYVRYATDVTFQQTNMPSGVMRERARYYSAKHHLHGYKVEVSVLPNGQAINCTQHFPGSESDIGIFRLNREFHLLALRKCDDDSDIRDEGLLRTEFPNDWAVIADKGYQGLFRDFRAVTPHKSRPLQPLTLEQMEANDRIAHDRILVENYFGRLCSLWAICADKYRWDEDNYDIYFRACVALTNFHIRARPLRAEDGETYSRYLQRLLEIGEDRRLSRVESQRRYRQNRRDRMNSLFAVHREGSAIDRTVRTPPARAHVRRRIVRTPSLDRFLSDDSSSGETELSGNQPVA